MKIEIYFQAALLFLISIESQRAQALIAEVLTKTLMLVLRVRSTLIDIFIPT
jgi:hypothetical protein